MLAFLHKTEVSKIGDHISILEKFDEHQIMPFETFECYWQD